jgi:hypothetical protein
MVFGHLFFDRQGAKNAKDAKKSKTSGRFFGR